MKKSFYNLLLFIIFTHFFTITLLNANTTKTTIDLTEKEREWIKNHPDIRLGIDPEFAPYEFIEDGTYKGIVSDYIKLLNKRLHLNMQIVHGLTWKEVIKQAKAGNIDVLPAVGITSERQQFLNYTSAYLNFHRVLITRNSTNYIIGVSELSDYTVGVQENSSHHGYLLDNTAVKPHLYKSLEEALLAVSGGEIDLLVGNVASSTYWIQKLNLGNLKVAAPISNEHKTLHFAIRKDWPELVSIIEKGLNTISAKEKKEISEKWLFIKYEPVVDYGLILKISSVLIIILALFFLWNIMLKRTVRARTKELEYSMKYDRITGLSNRFLTLEKLQQSLNDAQYNKNKIALLLVDIKNFEAINRSLDNAQSDSFLQKVAQRLKDSINTYDTIGKPLGVDQFLIIHRLAKDSNEVIVLIKKLEEAFKQHFSMRSKSIEVSINIGVSIFPDDTLDAELLLQHSETALHFCKNKPTETFTFFTQKMHESVSRRVLLEHHLRQAMQNDEFKVHYQPKVDTQTKQIVSFEALVRWVNPTLGFVSPDEFIPLAENSGLIEDIDLFVLQKALRLLSKLQKEYKQDYSMAVNLSPIHFLKTNCIGEIKSIIASEHISPAFLELEITEGILIANYDDIEQKLKKLRSLGVKLSLDDFGTGYSSLSYLRKYPFDILKIDQEFIWDLVLDISDRKLVSATIAMAHELDMTVVSEGVETVEQYEFLREHQCDYIQGWLFSKALPEDELIRLLENYDPDNWDF